MLMNTLLFRLAGPMQSWGVQSRFSHRDTGLEPSKSGVIGLLCAALGRRRHEPPDDLASLRLGVRVDREGLLKMDFHTAGGTHRRGEKYGVAKADGGKPDTVTSQRYYLADADFLVGLEGEDEEFLLHLNRALLSPRWPLYLGRKAFVLGCPIALANRPPGLPGPPETPGLLRVPLEQALYSYPWVPRNRKEKDSMLREINEGDQAGRAVQLRMVLDAPFGSSPEVRPDLPLSFAERSFTLRCVRSTFFPLRPEMIQEVADVSLPTAP